MLLIKNVKLYSQDAPLSEILVCGKEILMIAPKIECSLPIDQVVDGMGMTAIPGYIDQHVHITGGGGEGGFSNQVPPLKLSQLIEAGVTTVVGLLGTDGTTRSIENLLAKTKAFNEEGWTAYCLTGSYEIPSVTITGSIKKDIALIQEIIGVKIAISDHRNSSPTKEELIKVACEARMGGLLSNKPGIMHMHTGGGKEELRKIIDIVKTTEIPVSVFRPTHLGPHIEQAAEFAALGGWVDVTAKVGRGAGIMDEMLKHVPIDQVTLSSDGNGSFPKWNEKHELIGIGAGSVGNDHHVIKGLVNDFGYKLEDAIKVLTINPAKALNLYPYKGVLQEKSCADIILLDKNLDINTVIANGKIFLEHGELMYTPKFE